MFPKQARYPLAILLPAPCQHHPPPHPAQPRLHPPLQRNATINFHSLLLLPSSLFISSSPLQHPNSSAIAIDKIVAVPSFFPPTQRPHNLPSASALVQFQEQSFDQAPYPPTRIRDPAFQLSPIPTNCIDCSLRGYTNLLTTTYKTSFSTSCDSKRFPGRTNLPT